MSIISEEEKHIQITALESKITLINEELGSARGLNRKNLIVHHADNLLGLFIELQQLRRLTFKEKTAIKFLNMYANKTSKNNAKKLKQARKKVEQLVKGGKLKGVQLDKDFE